MKGKWGRLSMALLCAAVCGGGTWAQKVSSKADENYNFAEHKRYMWKGNRLMTRQNPDTNEVMDLKIVKVVNQTLASKGFVEVKEKPDFYIFYDAGGHSNVGAGGASQVEEGPTTTADQSPGFGMGMGPAMAPTTWLKVNGQISFHMVAADSSKPVWESSYSKTFRDPNNALKNMDKEVDELVKKSFKEFPPKAKK